MPRSLGSVYGASVTRFLGDVFRGEESCVIPTPDVKTSCNGVAVSRDGSTLLVSDKGFIGCGSHAIHEFRVADGSRLRVIGGAGDGRLQFERPHQVWVASDGFVFVADFFNHHVQVLTPRLGFHRFVGVGQLDGPSGVCADDDVIVVSEADADRITVFNRRGGARLRRFGSQGSGDGQLSSPLGLCFIPRHRHVAVADWNNRRVSVFSIDGEFVRHVGVGVLRGPKGVACSAFDELVVADFLGGRVVVFSASGEVLTTMGPDYFTGVTIHGGTIFAHAAEKCILFK
jgi:DNA-binding beta-propeller fold protein YncE